MARIYWKYTPSGLSDISRGASCFGRYYTTHREYIFRYIHAMPTISSQWIECTWWMAFLSYLQSSLSGSTFLACLTLLSKSSHVSWHKTLWKGHGWVSIVVLSSRQMTNGSHDLNFFNFPWIRSFNRSKPCPEILLTYFLSSNLPLFWFKTLQDVDF